MSSSLKEDMAMDSDIKKMGTLGLALLALMFIIGVFFLVGNLWQENLCTQADSDYVWNSGECQVSSTNTTEASVDAITYVGYGITAFVTLLGFLTIIVLVGVAKLLLKMVKSF